jgi:ribonuclease J
VRRARAGEAPDHEPYQIHASGHASYPKLKKMVEDIKPKKVIPIHTEHPELFKQMHDNVECPKLESNVV